MNTRSQYNPYLGDESLKHSTPLHSTPLAHDGQINIVSSLYLSIYLLATLQLLSIQEFVDFESY